VACRAGARPQTNALTTDIAMLASSTRTSIRNGIVVGSVVGMLKVLRACTPRYPTPMPASPPRHARIRLSVSSSRIRRKTSGAQRQTDGDFRAFLVRARLNRSPATLVQATSSTASARTEKITLNFQLMSEPCVRISKLRVDGGAAAAIALWVFTFEVSARLRRSRSGPAVASCPVFSRAFHAQLAIASILEEILLRVGRKTAAPWPAACRSRDARISACPENASGATPITVKSVPFRRIVRADDGRVAGEFVLPEIRPEHHHGVAAGHLVFGLAEAAPELRLHAKDLEVIAGNHHAAL